MQLAKQSSLKHDVDLGLKIRNLNISDFLCQLRFVNCYWKKAL